VKRYGLEPCSIGVDLGGTNLRIAAYAQEKGLLETLNLTTRRSVGRNAVIVDLIEAVQALRKTFGSTYSFAGVGVAAPGPMELPEGRLLDPPNLPGWENFPLRSELERALGIDVQVENDANVAALAECLLGQGQVLGVDSLCMITLGTGVGSGIVLRGSIWHGMNGMAGESGHVSVDYNGDLCPCGTRGCLELYASATGLVRMAEEMITQEESFGLASLHTTSGGLSSGSLFELGRAGDPDAQKIFRRMGVALGRALAGLVNALNLPLYVLGGGVAAAWPLFAQWMFDELAYGSSLYRLTDPLHPPASIAAKAKTHVLPARLGASSGLLGACLLPFTASHWQRSGAKNDTMISANGRVAEDA
jgi:glucokinase